MAEKSNNKLLLVKSAAAVAGMFSQRATMVKSARKKDQVSLPKELNNTSTTTVKDKKKTRTVG